MPRTPATPKNYFLNESHELSLEEKNGGGRYVAYLGVDWPHKARRLHESLQRIQSRAMRSSDPLSGRKYYILTDPEPELTKESKAQGAIEGRKVEGVSFSGEQSKLFERVGLDLIEVHPSGSATVHATPERMEQLLSKTAQLVSLGAREQSRFVAFSSFEWIPSELKFDKAWLDEIGSKVTEGYIKLQPLISELEADRVIRALEERFRGDARLRLRGKGRTYLGRFFLRATMDSDLIRSLADEFSSIQSIHPPVIALAESLPPEIPSIVGPSPSPTAGTLTLPTVGVVDTAVPEQHQVLQNYRRGVVTGLNCSNTENDDHGSFVASRIVFGDVDLSKSAEIPNGSCRFLEVRVGNGPEKILVESVSAALATAIGAAPDVRVFNLSFDGALRLEELPPRQRAEALKHIEEIDNFAFDQDVVVVVAAGNAVRGLIPVPGYPLHYDNSGWEMHTIPRSFNALTCGGTAAHMSAGGLASEPDAPSPFTRLGPGFAKSPKPDFCAPAGDANSAYRSLPGSGVWGFGALGHAKEGFGTSYAAPLLAREAAFVLEELRARCPGDARPFACAVKAVLGLTADDVASKLDPALHPLAKRALGYGYANSESFRRAQQSRARFVWQGVIPHDDELVRVQLPIPSAWLEAATSPRLQVCVAWNTPVSSAAVDQWACRDVRLILRPGPEAEALRGSMGRIPGYPLFKRTWNFEKARARGGTPEGDAWTLEFSYSEIAAYAAGHFVSPPQRLAFAAEIWDENEAPLDPHTYIQSLPIAPTLIRLSNTAAWLPQPITITSDY